MSPTEEEDIPFETDQPNTLDSLPEDPDEELEDPTLDGVPGEVLDSREIAGLPPLEPLEVIPAAPASPLHSDGVGLDLVEPPAALQAEWADNVIQSPSLDELDFYVTNRSNEPMHLGLSLVSDSGTTRGSLAGLRRLSVPAGTSAHFRVPSREIPLPSNLPHPGMLQFTIGDGDRHSVVLSELFIDHASHESGVLWQLDSDSGGAGGSEGELGRTVEWLDEDRELPVVEPAEQGTVAASVAALDADEYRTCVRWQARTTDSGNGEDRLTWGDSSTALVTAYGVRVRISRGSWSRTYDTSPTTGCIDWETSLSGPFTVRVYYYVEDVNGNAIRYHSGGDTSFGSYPGSTYWVDVNNYMPVRGTTRNVSAGNWSSRATTMAVASMVSRYYSGYASNTQIHIGDDIVNSSNGSSAHFCTSDCRYSTGDTYVRFQTSGSDHRRQKFIVAHELGHARAILRQGRLEPSVDSGLNSGGCSNGPSYGEKTREWNVIGLREGYAHFVAARTFNYTSSSTGIFYLFNRAWDLEGPTTQLGGIIENQCGGASDGHSTNIDSLRMIWDWDTPDAWESRAERRDISDTYLRMVNGSPGRSQYYTRFRDAAEVESSTAEFNTLRSAGAMNGMHDLL